VFHGWSRLFGAKDAAVNAPFTNAPLDGADGQKTISGGAVPMHWWRLYDDPVLDDLVQQAMASNTDLRVAAANLGRSRAALSVAQEQGGFSGGTSAAFKRAQESGEQFLLTEKVPVANEGDIGINISYEIDLFGVIRRGVEAAAPIATRPKPPPILPASP